MKEKVRKGPTFNFIKHKASEEEIKRASNKSINIYELQKLPVDLNSTDGGIFAKVCNEILHGYRVLISLRRRIRND